MLALALVSCGDGDSSEQAATISASANATPTFEAQTVDIKQVDVSTEAQHDDGINMTVRLQKVAYNNQGGGTVIYVLVTNDNDAAMPADAFPDPTLTVGGENIDRIENGTQDLELPLEAHASTNLAFAFDIAYGNLGDAEFQISNLKYQGNLNNLQ